MPPLRAPVISWAAFAPLRAAEVERCSRSAAATIFIIQRCDSGAGMGGGKSALRHNKSMHAIRDLTVVINL
jgi:hypothetical protein